MLYNNDNIKNMQTIEEDDLLNGTYYVLHVIPTSHRISFALLLNTTTNHIEKVKLIDGGSGSLVQMINRGKMKDVISTFDFLEIIADNGEINIGGILGLEHTKYNPEHFHWVGNFCTVFGTYQFKCDDARVKGHFTVNANVKKKLFEGVNVKQMNCELEKLPMGDFTMYIVAPSRYSQTHNTRSRSTPKWVIVVDTGRKMKICTCRNHSKYYKEIQKYLNLYPFEAWSVTYADLLWGDFVVKLEWLSQFEHFDKESLTFMKLSEAPFYNQKIYKDEFQTMTKNR